MPVPSEGIGHDSLRAAWSGDGFGIVSQLWPEVPAPEYEIRVFFTFLDLDASSFRTSLPLTEVSTRSSLPDVAWTGSDFGVAWSVAGESTILFNRIGLCE